MSNNNDKSVEDLSAAVKVGLVVSDDDDSSGNNSKKQHDRWTLLDESTIDYGYVGQTGGAGINEYDEKINDNDNNNKDGAPFYLTTAINYTNGPAHMGHAYEGVTSDVISRLQRLKGDRPCYFVTGADEHGQKIAAAAADQGKEPQEICDKVRPPLMSDLNLVLLRTVVCALQINVQWHS
jgi:hypothetical protein